MKGLYILFVLGSVIFVPNIYGQESAEGNSKKPDIKFLKTTHNFGKIPEGPKYKHEFKFINTGNSSLMIDRAKTACRCLTPKWPEKAISPGDTGVIQVKYFSDNRTGEFFKAVRVYTNVPGKSLRILYVKGMVREKK